MIKSYGSWEAERRRWVESATKAAKIVQVEDIVVFVWASCDAKCVQQLMDILPGISCGENPEDSFCTKRVQFPLSSLAPVLFFFIPAWHPAFRSGVGQLVTRVDNVALKSSAHIYLQHTGNAWSGPGERTSGQWDFLCRVLGAEPRREMDRVTFIFTDWSQDAHYEHYEQEKGVQRVLQDDIRAGLTFERLEKPVIKNQVWEVLQRAVDACSHEGRKLKKKRAAELYVFVHLQKELDDLYRNLAGIGDGRRVRANLQRTHDNQKSTMEPLLAQLNKKGITSIEKERLERAIEEEYFWILREFRDHFAEASALGVEVGSTLRSFYNYGLPDTVPQKATTKKKKRKKILNIF
ncbi:hypothetical protein NP233_g6057 [Leucocoprinus birnbaumii]|uniref:Uncharacterized protein n=1 Tax=Leucocoprinus birnbaumii TaxID=56174 RepID=A0AAD5VUF2_9AGAR|nr:hypothetical protein NP233_g6057 [Leucocoprinus birnbaumii]